MRNIFLKWLGISIGIALIPVFILGATQGGIALSPIILVLGIVVGLVGASIHINIYAYKNGTKQQKYKAAGIGSIISLLVVFSLYDSAQCDLSESFAKERVVEYINSQNKLELHHLGSFTYSEEQCIYSAPYKDPSDSFTFIVSEYGDLHFARE